MSFQSVQFYSEKDPSWKRTFDVLSSTVMLVIFAPLMLTISVFLFVYGAGNGSGSVFFRHERVGRNGIPFSCLKFRTMRPDAEEVLEEILERDAEMREEWERERKLTNDPRIIPIIGTLLRKASLDELPQLFNVMLGDMSVVGPRPVTNDELDRYGPYKAHYLSVRPGLTGPWQIGGRSNSPYQERVAKDVAYCENLSLLNDAMILVRTALYFASGRLAGGR